MHRLIRRRFVTLASLGFILLVAGIGLIHSKGPDEPSLSDGVRLPVMITHVGSAPALERAPVAFDHDRHTTALKQAKKEDCGVCHLLKASDMRLINPEVGVFEFPKGACDKTDKASIMYAYHLQCVNCHVERAESGKKTGPVIGLCGLCHARKDVKKVVWPWSPIFNYGRHLRHVQAAEKFEAPDSLNVAGKVEVVGEITKENKTCRLCHHVYDERQKKLIYKKDTENSCGACHKDKDEKNARAMKKVAHSACISCHMKLSEKVKKEAAQQGRTELTEQDKKRFGPFECKGCHGEHKDLTPDELRKLPRLARGQKDIMDLSLVETGQLAVEKLQVGPSTGKLAIRMKVVPYNHKAHEPRAQFCNACHHHSLEKCSNCHPVAGDAKKGGGITYERAFHKAASQKSCVGCHQTKTETSKCAGCHQWMPNPATVSSCPVCHRGPSEGKPMEVAPTPLVFDKEKVPEKVVIKDIEKEFKPAELPHLKIITKLTTISNESSLARWFHAAKEQTLCQGCHHNSQGKAEAKVPKCIACHSQPFAPSALGKPGIRAAYHRQCMGCHAAMKQKPAALECAKCHPAKEAVKTAGLPQSDEGKKK